MTPANLLSLWADLLLHSLADAGIEDVIISPGSRSTPFVLAASRTGRLRCHDVIDERAAAFYALGMARTSGRPPLLMCTSGTAPAHYLPAVIEAGAAHLPLLILSADRPLPLQGCAAAQTVDQVRLYGDHARAFIELGAPDASPLSLSALRRRAAQAVLQTRHPLPGAVHINARADKPLEPRVDDSGAGLALSRQVQALLRRPLPQASPPILSPDPAAIDQAARLIAASERGLIVCGPAPLSQGGLRDAILALAHRCGYPLLCESASQLRLCAVEDPARITSYELLLGAPVPKEAEPDVILQIGAPPTSGAWERFIAARGDRARIVLAPHGWNDPHSSAHHLLLCEVGAGIAALLSALPQAGSAYLQSWRERDLRARRIISDHLSQQTIGSEAAAIAAVLSALPAGSLLMLGNSLPIREVELYAPPHNVQVDVLSQRGASGIDGLISGAAGAARRSGRPLTLLVGDVSFLHDIGGLLCARGLQSPLCVVVINNQGGRIFDQLPIARAAEGAALAHFTTPHQLDLSHAARLYGHRHLRVSGHPRELAAAVADAHGQGGCTVVEAIVDPDSAARELVALRQAIAQGMA